MAGTTMGVVAPVAGVRRQAIVALAVGNEDRPSCRMRILGEQGSKKDVGETLESVTCG